MGHKESNQTKQTNLLHKSGEVMAVGLNSLREICASCPLAIEEDLLQDLAQYKNHKVIGIIST